MENFIQLKKDNILRFGIKDAEGNVIEGKYLEFDIEDISLPLRLNKMEIEHKKNLNSLKIQLSALEKKEDKKGKYLLSWKEEEGLKIVKTFFEKEIDTLDLFLGKGMTRVLLNGREPYYEMFDDIVEMLQPIMPVIEENFTSLTDRIKQKYSKKETKEDGELMSD